MVGKGACLSMREDDMYQSETDASAYGESAKVIDNCIICDGFNEESNQSQKVNQSPSADSLITLNPTDSQKGRAGRKVKRRRKRKLIFKTLHVSTRHKGKKQGQTQRATQMDNISDNSTKIAVRPEEGSLALYTAVSPVSDSSYMSCIDLSEREACLIMSDASFSPLAKNENSSDTCLMCNVTDSLVIEEDVIKEICGKSNNSQDELKKVPIFDISALEEILSKRKICAVDSLDDFMKSKVIAEYDPLCALNSISENEEVIVRDANVKEQADLWFNITIHLGPGIDTYLHIFENSNPVQVANGFFLDHAINATSDAIQAVTNTISMLIDAKRENMK